MLAYQTLIHGILRKQLAAGIGNEYLIFELDALASADLADIAFQAEYHSCLQLEVGIAETVQVDGVDQEGKFILEPDTVREAISVG